MRLAIVKPDHHITGGFELVVERVRAELSGRGHDVSLVTVDAGDLGPWLYGLEIPAEEWAAQPQFFSYMALCERFSALDLRTYDAVISTQPPSFAVRHPRHLSIFYHHARGFYDLAEEYRAGGFVDPVYHAMATVGVRRVDGRHLDGVRHLLVPSRTVEARLRRYHDLRATVSPFQAGIAFGVDGGQPPGGEVDRSLVLCVSRHEFPKRTELVVHALCRLPEMGAAMVGAGGRLPWVRAVDARLRRPGTDLDAVDDRRLWAFEVDAEDIGDTAPAASSNVRFLGHVAADELRALYARALCVIAPAYQEDYGLTAVEAMAHGRPVVVCSDGGGLAELVADGENGLVVEPSGRAVADAVRRLGDDPALAERLGAEGRRRAAEFTWERAAAQLLAGLDAVAS